MVALDRRRPDRHVGEASAPRNPTAPGVPGTTPRRWKVSAPTPRSRGAPSRCSSAAPPRCRSPSPARSAPPPPGRRPKAPAKPGLGYVPANVEQPFAQNINAVLISPPQAPVDTLPLPSAVTVPGQPPNIIGRAQWGADEAMRCGNTVYDNGIRAAIVHHTAGSNDYAPQDSAGIVRSIYEYHTRTLGWCDIAYNALVDKYGQVFEGRAGGMDKPVEGVAHRRLQPQHLGRGDDGRLRRRAADADPAADHRPAAGLAARHRPRRSAGHGRIAFGGWLVHQVPGRCDADAADDLHPPRRRQHRLPGQRGVRGDGPAPRHRGAVQRPARARGSGRVAARRRDLRPVGFDGRDEQPARRAHLAGGLG